MKSLRKRVIVALVLSAAAIAAVFVALDIFAHAQRAQVRQELRKLLGNDVTFESVEASVWGGIGFVVKEFRIADNPEFAATPFVYARELRLGMSLWHLLQGRLVINSLRFDQPEFQIITNEAGLLNVTALANRKKELAAFPRLRTGSADKRSAPVSFLISRLKVVGGRVDFIDRSISAPAALQIKNVELDIGWLDVTARAKIRLAAAVTEGLGRDVRIEGEMGPPSAGKTWSQQPVNLEMQFDSLYLPMLARAMPFFRDRIPRELDITGPMYLHANLTGTLQRPRITRIVLKIPFLGSSDYNAILAGKAEFTESRDWAEALIEGKLTLNAISLAQLRKLPLLKRTLPVNLATQGSVNLYTRFEGSWNQLRMGVLVEADKSDINYPGWFRKETGQRTQLRAQLSRYNGRFVLYPSPLDLGKASITVAGALGPSQARHLALRLNAGRSELKYLQPFLAPGPFDVFAGALDWNLLFEKNPAGSDGRWEVRGVLNLDSVALRHKASGKKIDGLTGAFSFSGRGARAPNLSLRLGSSALRGAVYITDLDPLRASYSLRCADLDVTDIPAAVGVRAGRMRDVFSSGELTLANQTPNLRGSLSSPAGILLDIPYRNLRTRIAWSPAGTSIKDLRVGAFAGELRAGGSWTFSGEQARTVWIAPQLEALSLRDLLTKLAPDLKDRFDGKLDFRGKFDAFAPPGGDIRQTLKGTATASIRDGTIKDFNLVTHLFYRGASHAPGAKAAPSLPERLAAIVARDDTPVENFKATLAVEGRRIRGTGLAIATPEYVVTGTGWIDFDGATQWNGVLTFSPKITRDLARQYGAIRYFVDRKGQLAVSFRLDGTLPNIRIRPENRALAQAFRWGTWQRGDDVSGREERSGKHWLPGSLERLLHR